MKKSDLRTPDYIEHILEAIGQINEYIAPLSLETFQSTRMAIDAVVRNLEIIGEAARNVILCDPAFVAAHPEIPWESMYSMRHRISHGYFAINANTIWVTVQRARTGTRPSAPEKRIKKAASSTAWSIHLRLLSNSSHRSSATSSSSSIAA